ncbi:MAG: proton-conducting transporter membrane subunit [Candidatus Margulisbacteria bacterium]|nr:proton-conducting transporter membrane subunit [Candidatus Margulisiibacteriota bacterium]
MELIVFLLCFPFAVSWLFLIFRNNFIRNILVLVSSAVIIVASLSILFVHFGQGQYFHAEFPWTEQFIFFGELVITIILLGLSLKHKKYFALLLVIIQTAIIFWFETSYGKMVHPMYNLYIDKLSIVMALIIGIIGSLICIYSIGYMQELHEHTDDKLKDKRPLFFFINFLFLAAMFGIVFANNLLWFYFFWEITTVSSFILIGYKGNAESIRNSFHALTINLFGGIFFIFGIIYLFLNTGVVELDQMLIMDKTLVLLPVIFFCIAGFTKSAQLPFSSWLLGAMVAPTPVSALLHSSTMVKAGVFLVVKMAPLLLNSFAGLMVASVGGLTFLIASLIAISQSDAKKVLAYSTIANLGLVIMCAGIGTYEAIWAAVLLIIFHAIAKGLLFLCVGVVEHRIGSRNIENMDGLIFYMPRVSWMLLVGMAGMFLAPFGMLISKWAVLRAVVDANPGLSVILIFGGSATLFFWVKWMGKILTVLQERPDNEAQVKLSEWTALYVLTTLTIAVCFFFPVVSHQFIEPYLVTIYGHATTMNRGNIIIMTIMMGLVILFRFSMPSKKDRFKVKIVDAYLSGLNANSSIQYTAPMGVIKDVQFKNYYLGKYFGEQRLNKLGIIVTSMILVIMVVSIAA